MELEAVAVEDIKHQLKEPEERKYTSLIPQSLMELQEEEVLEHLQVTILDLLLHHREAMLRHTI